MNSINLFVSLLSDLTGVSSTTEKTTILKRYLRDPGVAELLNMTLSPYITYGVKNFEIPEQFSSTDADSRYFFEVADRLQKRTLTGGAARVAISNMLAEYTAPTADALARVLRQDLKVSVGRSLINKAAGMPICDDFDVQLADKMSDKFDWNGGPYYVEYKYDGMRLIAHVNTNTGIVVYRSRDGRIQENVPEHVTEQLVIAAKHVEANLITFNDDIVFDGEIIAQSDDGKESYHGTMSMMKSSKAKDRSTLRFRMFDTMPLYAWKVMQYDVPFMERRRFVELACSAGTTHVIASQGKLCTTADEVRAQYAYLLSIGSEGAIIKKPQSKYLWKRSRDWTKLKPIFTADLTCTGIYEGDELNGFKGTLGGLQLEGELEDGTFVKSDCGSGFKLKRQGKDSLPTRDEIFKDPSLVVGHTIEVEYQEVTMAKTKEIASLRFVIFKDIRTDK